MAEHGGAAAPPSAAGEVDVLVLASSGVGHYHPVAAFVGPLAPPERIAFAAMVPDSHPMRAKIAADGFQFVRWDASVAGGPVERALKVVRRTLVRRVAPRLAQRGTPGDALPGLTARMTFALASLLGPLTRSSKQTGAALESMVTSLRPRLILSEGYDDWLAVLAARHGIAWARYTTGPVSELSRDRPTEPAGFAPALDGAEGRANRLLLALRQARERTGRRRVRRAARDAATGTAPAQVEPLVRFAFSCPALDQVSDRPTAWRYAGLSPYHAPPGWDAPPTSAAERDTVLVTWGSGRVGAERELLQRLLPVLVHLAAHLRIVIRSNDPALREELAVAFPPEARTAIEAHHPEPPYEEYARAALVVTHGGWGTINEAVALGSPVLVLPELVADRMETARRVLHAGVGGSANRSTATTGSLQASIDALLADPRTAAAVGSVGADLRDRTGAHEILDVLRRALTEP